MMAKGQKKNQDFHIESDLECAVREFYEETNLEIKFNLKEKFIFYPILSQKCVIFIFDIAKLDNSRE